MSDTAPDHVEVVRRVYEFANEFASGREVPDSAARVEELWHPDVVVEERADFPDTATYRGYEGLGRWWIGMLRSFERTELHPEELTQVGDRVVAWVRHVLRARGGVDFEYHGAHVWTLRDGRVVHVTGYRELDDAMAAVSSDPEAG